VVSTVIVVECEEPDHVYKVQRPVYFISEVLNESKARYPQVQKLIYAILIYFDGYRVVVMTNFPLGDIIRNKDANGCIVKWAMELYPYSIKFQGCMAIKSQALVDFIVEWTDLSAPFDQGPTEYWKMYFDGSLNIDGAGAGVLFISPIKE
jgi:hypothetical protein